MWLYHGDYHHLYRNHRQSPNHRNPCNSIHANMPRNTQTKIKRLMRCKTLACVYFCVNIVWKHFNVISNYFLPTKSYPSSKYIFKYLHSNQMRVIHYVLFFSIKLSYSQLAKKLFDEILWKCIKLFTIHVFRLQHHQRH